MATSKKTQTKKVKKFKHKPQQTKEIKAEEHRLNNLKRKEAKEVKNKRRKDLANLKKVWKTNIKNATSKNQKKELKENYTRFFKDGYTQNTPGNIVDVQNVTKFYVTKRIYEKVLDNVSFQIKEGEICVLLGASGSGKTTLLNILSGLANSDSGHAIVLGRDLYFLNEKKKTKFRKDNISFVFQSYNLIQSLTVLENIKTGFALRNKKDKHQMNLDEILKVLGLEQVKDKYPYQLSGGQQQRVSIGRALAKNPKILFADEPTGALDEQKGREILEFLYQINKKYGTTMIMVTHNPNIALMANHVIKVKSGHLVEEIHNKHTVNPKEIKWA